MHVWRKAEIKLAIPRKFHSIISSVYDRFLVLGGDW